ncbi:MAG: type III polyketide synthase [Actinomycetota bacterium]|nr:type III polyketide synthase [Actinomycetota bacterium]
MRAVIAGSGSSFPAAVSQDALWEALFSDDAAPLARRLWRSAGVQSRHGVAVPPIDDVRAWTTEARMRRFGHEALPLSKEAVASCLAGAGVDAAEVDLLTVVSCTGYTSPGLDVLVARDLGMPSQLERVQLGHMGCYAALPGLAVVADAAVARDRTGVLLCVELSSLHVQPSCDDIGQVVAHALFSDAAAAVAVRPGGPGLEIIDIASRSDPALAELLSWDITDHGFRVHLSPEIPAAIDAHVGAMVGDLLAPHGLEPVDVAAWAIHPGGPRVVDRVGERLGLDDAALGPTRAVLAAHGNCSSPTVLLVLEQLVAEGALGDGDHVVCVAFGAGLTLYAALLRRRTAE